VLTVAEARARVLAAVGAPSAPEHVPVATALDRVLAAPVRATGDVPPFASSAMDGWAVRAGASGRVRVVGESRAGRPAATAPGAGEAVRISTGAAVPPGAAVVRLEDAREEGDEVVLEGEAAPGANVRSAGEDMRAGQEVVAAGTRLGPAELAAAVAAGLGHVEVARPPSLSVLCTGDELRPPGAPLGPGEIHNSNGVGLLGLARRAGAEVSGLALVRDDADATRDALAGALVRARVVVISGGVSVGPHDHVKPALAALGVDEVFWRVALQPGKPTWFGTRDDTLVFGLPGNPVSALVCFHLFVAPALRALQGAEPIGHIVVARLAHDVRPNPDRLQALRVRIEGDETGFFARTTGPQGSHLVTSLVGAQGLALVPPGGGAAGEWVPVEIL